VEDGEEETVSRESSARLLKNRHHSQIVEPWESHNGRPTDIDGASRPSFENSSNNEEFHVEHSLPHTSARARIRFPQ
jgi:hypothetical protein